MSSDLIEQFKNTAGNIIVLQSGSILGESPESTSSAVNAVASALMGSLILKGSTERGARELMDYMTASRIDETLIRDAANLLDNGPAAESLKAHGGDMLKYLVGDNVSGLVDAVASGSGFKTSSASTLLKMAAPLLMSLVTQAIKENSLGASGLSSFLLSQKEFVNTNAPAGINNLVSTWHITPESTAHGILTTPDNLPTDNRSTMSKLLPWIVLLIAALGLFYFLEKGGGPAPADLDKVKKDSIENLRKMDSIK